MRYPLSRALRHQSRSSGTPFTNPPYGVEHGAPHEHRGGNREVEVLDVSFILEGEDALERFGGGHPQPILDQDVDASTDKIRRPQLGKALFEPPPVRPAVAVDERERVAARCENTGVAGRSGAALGDLKHPAASSDDPAHGVEPARTAIVGDDDFRPAVWKALIGKQGQTGVEVIVVVQMRHDHRHEADAWRPAARLLGCGLYVLADCGSSRHRDAHLPGGTRRERARLHSPSASGPNSIRLNRKRRLDVIRARKENELLSFCSILVRP
jgi:hypothetical protein